MQTYATLYSLLQQLQGIRGHEARAAQEKATEKRGQSFATFVQDALKVAAVAVAVRCESSRQVESVQRLHSFSAPLWVERECVRPFLIDLFAALGNFFASPFKKQFANISGEIGTNFYRCRQDEEAAAAAAAELLLKS